MPLRPQKNGDFWEMAIRQPNASSIAKIRFLSEKQHFFDLFYEQASHHHHPPLAHSSQQTDTIKDYLIAFLC